MQSVSLCACRERDSVVRRHVRPTLVSSLSSSHLRFHSNISTVCPGGPLCTNSTARVLICAVQLSGGANSAAPGLLAGFWGGEE